MKPFSPVTLALAAAAMFLAGCAGGPVATRSNDPTPGQVVEIRPPGMARNRSADPVAIVRGDDGRLRKTRFDAEMLAEASPGARWPLPETPEESNCLRFALSVQPGLEKYGYETKIVIYDWMRPRERGAHAILAFRKPTEEGWFAIDQYSRTPRRLGGNNPESWAQSFEGDGLVLTWTRGEGALESALRDFAVRERIGSNR